MIKYIHTNIIAKDWKKLVEFYTEVFDCVPVPPERDLSGDWLDKAAALNNAHLKGMHLKLPGYADSAPTLEIFSYREMEENSLPPHANRIGLGHLAFLVDDVNKVFEKAIACGGKKLGQISKNIVDGVGTLTFVYLTDPENNIIEIQKWDK